MENKPSKLAIAGIIAGVAAYDILCPPGETISEGVDRIMESVPGRVAAVSAIGITALHLINVLPPVIDPLHRLTSLKSLRKDRE